MGLPSFCNHTITVETPGKKTVHGSSVDDWSTSTSRTIDFCWVEPTTTDENNNRRDVTRATYDLLIPADADPPQPRDRVTHPLASGPYKVQGESMPVDSASGFLSHYFAVLERWKFNA